MLIPGRGRARRLGWPAAGLVAIVVSGGIAYAASADNSPLGTSRVGRQADGSVLTAENKFITPAGVSIEQAGQPMDLGLRPDGKTALTLTKYGKGLFTVLDLVNHTVLQQYSPPKGTGDGTIGVGGVLYAPDGKSVYVTQARDVLRLAVGADGTVSAPTVIPMPTSGPGGSTPTSTDGTPALPLPTDLAWTSTGTIAVVLDGFNSLAVLDPATNTVTQQTAVGVAPRDVVLVGTHAFVSNEAGRTPTSTDFSNLTYDSAAVAETRDGRASTGTVSEVDLATHAVVHTYDVGLDPSTLLVHGTDVLVTNSSDDTVSVLDTTNQQVTQTFTANPLPGQPYGSSPNALAFLDAHHLAVSLGRDNAVAVYDWEGDRTAVAFSGLIPVAWYPGSLTWDAPLGRLVVGNLKGVGALAGAGTISEGPGTSPATGKQVYKDEGVVELVDTPSPAQIAQGTTQVFRNNQWNGLAQRNTAGSASTAPVAIPARIGDPSTIKHVFLIVRENRTYDQELGDDTRGNGEPSYAQFGAQVTPNAHALAKRFPLIDNLYSDGTNSATGHTWLDAGFVNDYLERSYANYVRDYGQPDAMVYPRSGFLWDDARAHQTSVRVWGEYAEYFTAPNGQPAQGTWSQWYHDSQVLEGKATGDLHVPVGYFTTKSDIPSLNSVLAPNFPNFNTSIPDQYRADLFQQDFAKYVKNGKLPALNMMWVMDDHTAGVTPGEPTPSAMVADNDLAVGRIIDTISHSSYWKDSAVFVVEDDSQNGVDHVDGHRNVTLLASPYAKKGKVDSTYYTQLNVTRTIEQILGLPPMNQLDLAATPMTASFTNTPNLAPYDALPNNIALDTLNPSITPSMPGIQQQWLRWSKAQDFTQEDQAQFEPMNRLTWYASTGYTVPYPGDATVMTPAEVLAKYPLAVLRDGDGTSDIPSRAQNPHLAGRGVR